MQKPMRRDLADTSPIPYRSPRFNQLLERYEMTKALAFLILAISAVVDFVAIFTGLPHDGGKPGNGYIAALGAATFGVLTGLVLWSWASRQRSRLYDGKIRQVGAQS